LGYTLGDSFKNSSGHPGWLVGSDAACEKGRRLDTIMPSKALARWQRITQKVLLAYSLKI
jgi:hypothetical protein